MEELYANSAQLIKAANLLRDAGKAVANGRAEERPGWLTQDDSRYLNLKIGIFGFENHRINRAGDEVV